MLIVGLGNPGSQYKKTPHNIGKEILEDFAKDFAFPPFKDNKKEAFSVTSKKILNQKIILAKPLIYMNDSGRAVKNLLLYFKLNPEDLWIIHDDLDLNFGKIKISKNRSSAGHKGVESIIDALHTKNFTRFRIGINPGFKPEATSFVLKKISKKEKTDGVIKLTGESLIFSIENGIVKAMSKYNK
ncbi:aminoacyl-tRNA hydrolase [bacterium (Candidatus Moisslbacteria) CG12_big_fil_rev_8_21_14_0_65_36_11]|nr:aminoacyl-tRNA hydrolase [Candidatus Kuenenbacteria bacterium]PIV45968.1 MAG: aminoacyl-tRNA hydrolase [bacterium (Candidatus Moisslbacteria) CG02_land_8_20_14_3_00_36_53]PIW67871.1 MAG: aminoacyl-tRNA hydrolase [bacterium (Candidatus Moisslbacteria) CG12_big_fil_rev_8_21_14_0_65_36_11]PJC00558.1 MAG: aminoacyl-tRNA hydrolase [bacterium (Candidatus Moisslbacteria) CG_4_9_14_0_8_um_filter_36_20]